MADGCLRRPTRLMALSLTAGPGGLDLTRALTPEALAGSAEGASSGDQAAGAGPDLTALVHGHVHGRGRGRGVWSVECGACV